MLHTPYLKIKKISIVLFLFLITTSNFAQTGIGRTKPRGALDINKPDGSNTSGLVLPSINNINLVVNPQGSPIIPGTIIYDAELDCLRYFSSKTNSWSDCLQINQTPPAPDLTTTDCGGALLNTITNSSNITLNNLSVTVTRTPTSGINITSQTSCQFRIDNALHLGPNGTTTTLTYKFSREVTNLKVIVGGSNMGEQTRYELKLKGQVVSGKIDLTTNIGCPQYFSINGTTIIHEFAKGEPATLGAGAVYNVGGVWFDEVTITHSNATSSSLGSLLSFCINNAK